WTGSQYIAVGDRGAIITSPNGLTWKTQTSPTTTAFHSVIWTGKLAVAVAGSPVAFTSPDGVTWTETTDRGERFTAYSLVWNGSQVIEVGEGGRISGSPTGETWTNIAGENEETIVGGAWTGREFAAVGNLGTTYSS